MRLTDLRSHAIVHCIPVDQAAFQRAPIVFKKALDEAESEWSQHHAKAVIDTKVKVRRKPSTNCSTRIEAFASLSSQGQPQPAWKY